MDKQQRGGAWRRGGDSRQGFTCWPWGPNSMGGGRGDAGVGGQTAWGRVAASLGGQSWISCSFAASDTCLARLSKSSLDRAWKILVTDWRAAAWDGRNYCGHHLGCPDREGGTPFAVLSCIM